ncbi:MAG: hypothetical protein RIT81_07430 [Deltaproteobacteria bacterium]
MSRWGGIVCVALLACRGLDPVLCEPCEDVCGEGLVCQASVCVAPGDPGACLLECAVTADCGSGEVCHEGMCHPRYVDVALAATTGCVLEPSGRVQCWGSNPSGLAGAPPSTTYVTAPTYIPGVEDATELECGAGHCCVVNRDRSLTCWGSDTFDQLAFDGVAPVDKLFAGLETTCALLTTGRLLCFGSNAHQQLGHPNDFLEIDAPITDMAMGARHTCALAGGRVYCWGKDAAGLFGATDPISDTRLYDTGLTDVTSIAAGFEHTCVTRESGSVLCTGPERQATVPDLGGRAVQVRASGSWTCARLEDGDVVCWGELVARAPLFEPIRIEGVERVELGFTFACSFDAQNALRCWGSSGSGELGVDVPPQVPNPYALDLSAVRDVDVGASHSCALDERGGLWCWGANPVGQLGSTAATIEGGPRVRVDLDEVHAFAAGGNHTCAIDASIRVYCWGSNQWGQVLPGADAVITAPVEVTAAPLAVALRANWDRTCVIDIDDRVTCWGRGFRGVAAVPELGRVRDLAVGDHHVCALTFDDTVVCTGASDFGQLGGSVAPNVPVPLPGPAAQVIAGGNFACARLEDGDVYCWGNNEQGALGVGDQQDRDRPERVFDVEDVVDLRGKRQSPCASSGDRWLCWGHNDEFNLANGNALDELRPVQIEHLSGVRDFVIGENHGCAVRADGRLECWGSNKLGQVTAEQVMFLEPTPVDGL